MTLAAVDSAMVFILGMLAAGRLRRWWNQHEDELDARIDTVLARPRTP